MPKWDFYANSSPHFKLVCLVLGEAIQDKVRILSFVYRQRFPDDHMAGDIIADNQFMDCPPTLTFPVIMKAIKTLAQVGEEKQLLARFVYAETNVACACYKCDIYFSQNPDVNLQDEFRQLYELAHKKVEQTIENHYKERA